MPNHKVEAELTAAGYTQSMAVCEKCGAPVERWTSPSGKSHDWNTPDHPRDPGVLHSFSCGELNTADEPDDQSEPFR